MANKYLLLGSIAAAGIAAVLLSLGLGNESAPPSAVKGDHSTRGDHAREKGSARLSAGGLEHVATSGQTEASPAGNSSRLAVSAAGVPVISKAVSLVLNGPNEYASIYTDLSKRSLDSLNNDEVSLLRYIQSQCAAVHSEASALRERVVARAKEIALARVVAANALLEGCKSVSSQPAEADALATEINRRQHISNQQLTLAFQGATGNGLSAISNLNAALKQADSLSVYGILSAVPSVAQVAESNVQGSVVPTTSHDLNEAWTLALCQVSGSCGANSPDVLWRCAVSNFCGANSPEDALRRFEPERFARVDAMRRNMVASMSSHDWSWLMLSSPRSSVSR
jgi:hypothetical protein